MYTKEQKERLLDEIEKDWEVLEDLDPELKNDLDFMLEALKRNASTYSFMSPKIKSNREVQLYRARQDGPNMLSGRKHKYDPEMVIEAVKGDGNNLKYASDDLKADRNFILKILSLKSSGAYQYIDERLKQDRELLLMAVEFDPQAIDHTEVEIDEKLALYVIKKGYKRIPQGFESNKNVVLEAVKCNPLMLYYADVELKEDPEIVLEALKRDPTTIMYAGEKFQCDPKIATKVVSKFPFIFPKMCKKARNTPEIALITVTLIPEMMKYVDVECKNNPEFIMKSLMYNSEVLNHLNKEYKNNPILVSYAKLDSDSKEAKYEIVKEEFLKSLKKSTKRQ